MLKFVFLLVFLSISNGRVIKKSPDTEQFIYGGQNISITEAPYQVAIKIDQILICGGFISTASVVVSSATCLRLEGNDVNPYYEVQAGSAVLGSGGVVVGIKNIIPHPKFKNGMAYDISVVLLQEPLTFSDSIQPLPLATEYPSPGEMVRTCGWGLQKEDGSLSKTLLSVEIPVVDKETCQKNLSISIPPYSEEIICAGLGDKDSCLADDGGALVYKGRAVGVTRFSVACGRQGFTRGYVCTVHPEVAKFLKQYIDS